MIRETSPAAPADISDAVFQVDSTTGALGGNVLGVIWKMIARYRLRMWLAIIFGSLSAICSIVPAVSAAMMVAALLEHDRAGAAAWAAGMIIGAILMVVFFITSTTISHLIAADVQRDQRAAIAAKLKSVPLGFFGRVSSMDLRKVLIDDVEQLEDGIAHLIPEITSAYVGPFVLLCGMLVLDWRLAIAAAAPTIFGFFFMSALMKKGVEPMNRFLQAQARIASTMGEVVKAIPVVKTYNNGDAALVRANEAINDFRDLLAGWIDKSIVPANWYFLFASSNLILLTPLSIYLWSTGSVGLPEITFFHLAAMSLALIVSALFGVANRLRQQEGVVARWNAVMAQGTMDFAHTRKAMTGSDIRFGNVRFGYGGKTVINDISFTVKNGTSLALVGPSGSGKTTLARLLARFWDVDSGIITVGGVDIREMPPEQLAENISFVFQEIFLFSRSVGDNIRIGKPDASDDELVAAAKAARAHDFIMELPNGYDTLINGATSLSVGQKQRLSIARALLRNAPVLVLDEATAFTDPENEKEVQEAISALAADKTLIVIAHRLSTIRNADQILFISGGHIVESGTHDELVAAQGAYLAQWQAHTAAKEFRLSNISPVATKEEGAA